MMWALMIYGIAITWWAWILYGVSKELGRDVKRLQTIVDDNTYSYLTPRDPKSQELVFQRQAREEVEQLCQCSESWQQHSKECKAGKR